MEVLAIFTIFIRQNKYIMKQILLAIVAVCLSFTALAQSNSYKATDNANDPKATYKLYPTQNLWTFLKLNTANGKIWQVQFSIKGSEYRYETVLNNIPCATGEKAKPGRFTLYPTENLWTFLMLDQIDGKVYQVQWAQDAENRGILLIE